MKKALLYLSQLLAPALLLLSSYFNLSNETERYYCCLLTTLLAVQLFISLLLKYNKQLILQDIKRYFIIYIPQLA